MCGEWILFQSRRSLAVDWSHWREFGSVNVGCDRVPDDCCLNDIAVAQSGPIQRIEKREITESAIPADNLNVLGTVRRASIVDLVSRIPMRRDCCAKSNLHFLKDLAVLIDGIDCRLNRLIRPP